MRAMQMSVLIVAALAIAVLAVMLLWPAGSGDRESLSFDRIARIEADDLPPLETYEGRDGAALSYRFYPADTKTVFILVHGSSYHGAYLHPLAAALAGSGIAQVAVPNIRGHYKSGPVRGDIGHIGQLQDDLAALMEVLEKQVAGARFVLGGHSSGGGFALRMAAGPLGKKTDGLVLLAPYLGHDAPTTRANSGGWASPDVPRIIALSILNAAHIRVFNGLTALTFNKPELARDGTETLAYSYRLMTAFGPSRTLSRDIDALAMPVLVVAGAQDEAMDASAYGTLFTSSNASVEIIGGAGHLDLAANGEAIKEVSTFLDGLKR